MLRLSLTRALTRAPRKFVPGFCVPLQATWEDGFDELQESVLLPAPVCGLVCARPWDLGALEMAAVLHFQVRGLSRHGEEEKIGTVIRVLLSVTPAESLPKCCFGFPW